jgi:predicted component of type VI protein secretion system
MPAQLVALNDGPSILLDKPILLIGRHPECDIQIDSRKISRRHCCIAQVDDHLVVRDLDSTNGIRINGVRVTEGRLNPGDELTIGSHRYEVTWEEVAPASPPIPPPQPVRAPVPRAEQAGQASPGRPSPLRDIEDDLLESFDEPVPLDEPESPPPRAASPKAPPAPPGAALRKEEDSVILPDNLELMPGSGAFPQHPPSHPPSA